MRLNCPGCGAQYEVDGSAIPDAGRDVQCSACGHGWFQYPQSGGAGSAFGAPTPFVPDLPKPDLPKPDLTKPDLPKPKPPAPNDIRAFLREEAARETAERRKEHVPPPAPPRKQPEVQPDIAAINSSLRPAPQRRRGGFWTGFFTTLVLFLLVAGVYVSAPRLAAALPELRTALGDYVTWVDDGRRMLDGFVAKVAMALRG